jgi:effector-binding domain-containing protein
MDPMRVASVIGFGPSPEAQAAKKMRAFMAAKGLNWEGVRWYGFNNPNPSPGSPNYGYEVWITVGPEVEGDGEVTIREIPARRYVMAHCDGLHRIGEDWKKLVLWLEQSRYRWPAHCSECLEHLLTHPDRPEAEYAFDLYLPIAD